MNPRERDLILRGLFELTITFVEDEQTRHGGDPEAMFYGATPPERRR